MGVIFKSVLCFLQCFKEAVQLYTSALEAIAASRNGVPDSLSSHGPNMDAQENNVMGGKLVENKGDEIGDLEARILVNRATVRCLLFIVEYECQSYLR